MIDFTVMFFGNLIYLPDVPMLFRTNVESQLEIQPNHIVRPNSNQAVSVFNDVEPDWDVIAKWLSNKSCHTQDTSRILCVPQY